MRKWGLLLAAEIVKQLKALARRVKHAEGKKRTQLMEKLIAGLEELTTRRLRSVAKRSNRKIWVVRTVHTSDEARVLELADCHMYAVGVEMNKLEKMIWYDENYLPEFKKILAPLYEKMRAFIRKNSNSTRPTKTFLYRIAIESLW